MSARGSGAFRPDIEGLRGVAILLVVLFHAGVAWLSGGFVAVDVFFVLSGFFITGLLARELMETGRVDLVSFLGGRAVRLLPALLVVLLTTLALVMWLYAPIDRAAVAGTGRSVALYASNIEFAGSQVDYFSSHSSPLLHTWSLGVEEQFYLVWPLLFVLVAWMTARSESETGAAGAGEGGSDATAIRRRLLIGVVTAGVVSFAASWFLTRTAQPSAFFGMTTRVWEFALGGALALLMKESIAERPGAGLALQFGAMVALTFAVSVYDRVTPYPGVAALAPALAAVALLVGGRLAPASAVSGVLSHDALRWLGRMSYAWYLWHWPLIGLGAVLWPATGVWGNLAWSALALLLAWVTYHFIEVPARAGALARVPANAVAPLALWSSVAAAGVAHLSLLSARSETSRLPQKQFAAAREDRRDHGCWNSDGRDPACAFGDRRSGTVLVLFGDSHAEHWLAALDVAGKERGWKIVPFVMGGCPVPEMPETQSGRIERWYRACARYREASMRRIIEMKPAGVILSNWDHYLPMSGSKGDWQVSADTWRRGLRRTYARLAEAGIVTVAIRGTPRTWFDAPACLSRRAARLPFAGACQYERAQAFPPAGVASQDVAARGLPVRFVDMNDRICAAPKCSVMRGGIVLFTDDNHLTRTFSRTLAPVFGARIAAAMAAR